MQFNKLFLNEIYEKKFRNLFHNKKINNKKKSDNKFPIEISTSTIYQKYETKEFAPVYECTLIINFSALNAK